MKEEKTIKKVLGNFSKILDSLGDYLVSMGNVEKENPDFVEFIDKMKNDPEYFDMVMEKLPEEFSKEVLYLFLKNQESSIHLF